MVKLTAVKISKLINRSPKYVYTLLHRKGISISDINIEELIDLIMQYRLNYKQRFMKKIGRNKYKIWYANSPLLVDQIIESVCPHCKECLVFPNVLPTLICPICDKVVERYPVVKGVKITKNIWK